MKDKIFNNKLLINSLICLTLLYLNGMATNGIFGELFPILGYKPLIILLLPLLLIMVFKDGYKEYFTKENITVGIIIAISIVCYVIGSESNYLSTALELGIFALTYNIYLFCKRNNTKKENKIIITILLVNFVLTCGVSILYLLKDPEIIRFTATRLKPGIAKKFDLKTTFLLGTIATQYACVILLMVCLDKIIKKNFIYILPATICGVFFVLGDSFMLLVEFAISLSIYVFVSLCVSKGIKKSLIVSVITIVGVVAVVFIMNGLNLLPKTISIRIDEVINSFNTGININNLVEISKEYLTAPTKYVPGNSDIESRLIVYICSIIGIAENKFIINPSHVLIGAHSTILDTLSLYGFVSLIIFYWFYRTIKNTYISVIKSNAAVCVSIFAFIFVAFLLDPCLNIDLALMIYFISPLLLMGEVDND